MTPLIGVPAWTAPYVRLATEYTIPAAVASLDQSPFRDARFLIHTDGDPELFRRAAHPYKAIVKPVPKHPPTHDGNWWAFKSAHRDVIASTPVGDIAVLLNSDIVVSVETFSVVERILRDKLVAVSVGIRTAVDHSAPPVGADAETLARWIWGNLHHISRECIWGTGRSRHPTVLYFEDENGVVMHGFHLTPMFIRRDARDLFFKGTIDDDLLYRFEPHEIEYMTDRAAMFAELSPDWKKHPFGENPITVEAIAGFGRRRVSKRHMDNFRQSFRVLGSGPVDNSAVEQILERMRR